MAVRYVAYNPEGKRIEGRLEVTGVPEAEEALFRDNLTVVSLKRERRLPSRYELFPSLFGVKERDIINFSRQLATLLQSGLPLMVALRALTGAVGNQVLRQAIVKVSQDVAAGDSFSEACARQAKVFPPLFVRLVQVGEGTGKLEPMLEQVANHIEKQSAMMGRIKQALIYPSFVMGVGMVAVYIVLNFSLPALTGLFKEYQAQLPVTTKILIAVGDIMDKYGGVMLAVTLSLALLVLVGSRTPRGKDILDRWLLSVPVAGDLVRKQNLAQVAGTISVLLGSGLPFTEAMELTIKTTTNGFFRKALHTVRDGVLMGQRLSQSLSGHPAFTELFVRMVAVGEEGGRLEGNLTGIGSFYEKETDRAITRLTSMIEPAIVVVIGLGVGFVAVAVLGSVYGILRQIK